MNTRTHKHWRRCARWLLRARRAATFFAGWPDFRRPPPVRVEPPDQPSPRRSSERAALRSEYPLVSGADALGLATAWGHRTVAKESRPGREDYPLTTTIPKYCVLMALTVDIPDDGATWASVGELDRALGKLGLPAIKAAWERDPDATFAELRVSGPNPMFLRRYDTAAALAADGLETPVPDGCYAVAYDRLFSGVHGASAEQRRFFSAAIAVFERDGDRLRPTGIQLRRAGGEAAWFPADGSWAWRLAMMHFNSCDFLAHELLAHFSWTHVIAEKFLLATARNLTWRHPLRRLLAPHMANTLNNNNNATPVLIRRGGLFDAVFGAGERGKLVGLSRGEAAWSFDKMVPARHIEERGLTDLPHYPYRDAALKLWAVVEEMVTEYVEHWYDSDERVLRDEETQAWAAELRTFAGPTVPAVQGRASLIVVLSAAIFNVLQHGFVNLLQYDALGYPPVYPVNVRVDVPDDPAAVTEQTLIDALPTVYESLSTIRATYGFSIQYGRMGAHITRFHRGKSGAIMRRFVGRLNELARAAPAAYPPANPARIGNSVDA
ncbi:MAG: lipoxygenase family protein [Myxococcota bacterium]